MLAGVWHVLKFLADANLHFNHLPDSDVATVNKSNIGKKHHTTLCHSCLTVNLNSLTANESKGGGGKNKD